ncbi:hypothetical protein [Methylocystis sp. SB2]|uniref:hypothetical protein n=1 Tax=Methylocystis sp. (strain SB2) TaxID=743836 RepID=UPI0012ED54E6|nr:hypothetical protein [Methylocystis sp. SB2]ULO23803.1 hypothetical protein LNB28_17080 [Methylocystis sp. SB2]
MATNNVRANVLKTESTKKQTELIVANVVAFVVFPAIIGLTGAFTSEIYNYDNGLIFVLWFIIILFFGLFWWRCYPAPQSLLKLIYENEEYESMIARSHQDIDSVTDSIRLLAAQAELALSYPSIVVGITDNEISTIEDITDGISDLCVRNQGSHDGSDLSAQPK